MAAERSNRRPPLFWRRPALLLSFLPTDGEEIGHSFQWPEMGKDRVARDRRDRGRFGDRFLRFPFLSGRGSMRSHLSILFRAPPPPPPLPHPALQLTHNEVLRFHRPRARPLRGVRPGKNVVGGVQFFLLDLSEVRGLSARIGRP